MRLAGGDAKAGDVLVSAGTRLRPDAIAVIAAAGAAPSPVRPRPRVVVLSTGSELAEPGTPIIPGRIWDSNSFMIAAAAREAGCLAYRQAIVPDNPEQVLPAIEDQLVRADLLVTTGGVSMGGEHDVVKAALPQLGTITFRKVAMQPGMPQGFGIIAAEPRPLPRGAKGRRRHLAQAARPRQRARKRLPGADEQVPIFTLPGNPVSAYVSFQVFVRPAIGALQADGGWAWRRWGRGDRAAALAARPALVPARRAGPPGRAGQPLAGQGSHQVATLGKANALIIVPEWVVQAAAGEKADVLVLP